MTNSRSLVDFVKGFEGEILHAYRDSAGIWTIGFGSIRWFDGSPITEGMTCTLEDAENLLMSELTEKSASVDHMTKSVSLNQNQFDALTDFAYNCGTGALSGSTLLKRVLANPSDVLITEAFLMWDKIHKDGQLIELPSLKQRRQAEANLYFT